MLFPRRSGPLAAKVTGRRPSRHNSSLFNSLDCDIPVKVLVIEDDAETGSYIAKGLAESGIVVDLATDGREGLVKAIGEDYDVAVVDRMLPGLDGLSVVETLRNAGRETPVLFLSAMGEVRDRVRGLRAGGDDYLAKPFAFSELLARIEALARRRGGPGPETVLRTADLEMDLLARQVSPPGQEGRVAAAGVPAAGVPAAPCRSSGDPHHAAGAGLGLSVRPTDQRDRRAHQPPAAEDRSRLRPAPDRDRARRGIPAPCVRLTFLHSRIFRLWLVYLLSFGTAVVVLLGYIHWSTTRSVTGQIDATIDAEITGLAEQFRQRGISGLIRAIERRSEAADDRRGLYLLTDNSFAPLAGNLSSWPRVPPDADGWITFSLAPQNGDGLANAGRARLFRLGEAYHLLVGHDIRVRLELAALIRNSLFLGLGVTLALAVLGALIMSRLLLAKIEAINAASREIMAGDLSRRVPISERADEFDRLALNLNAMLDQIERLLEGMRQVSDNIAHDLRSPLTRLRSRLEVTLLERSDEAAYRSAIERTIAEADDLLKTFNALLSIAQAEAGAAGQDFEAIDLGALLNDAAELYEPLAEERALTLRVHSSGQARILGDRNMVFQAIANLIDNAIKFSPEDSEIRLSLTAADDHATLSVADRGPGIPAEQRARVTDRFYRLESSRSTPGSGLGLSLVAAVARLHDAALTFHDGEPGLRAELRFPVSAKRTATPRPPAPRP